MVSHSSLREVVCSNTLRSVPTANLCQIISLVKFHGRIIKMMARSYSTHGLISHYLLCPKSCSIHLKSRPLHIINPCTQNLQCFGLVLLRWHRKLREWRVTLFPETMINQMGIAHEKTTLLSHVSHHFMKNKTTETKFFKGGQFLSFFFLVEKVNFFTAVTQYLIECLLQS